MTTLRPPSTPGTAAPARRRLLLASRSPRRRLLLQEAGIDHEVCDPGVDDGILSPPRAVGPAGWVRSLAYLKARAAALLLAGDDPRRQGVVLGADTVVVKGAAVIGQPRDRADAERILRTLSGGRHRVITGVALLDLAASGRRLLHDAADVEVGPLSEPQIGEYLDSEAWRGKAGAYNLAERIEAGWPIRYSGDPATIMGLPMRALAPALRDLLGAV